LSTVRQAVYFTPAVGSRWWRFGADWLGRDDRSETPEDDRGAGPGAGVSPQERASWTATPRRYGFHATLKAPMRLRPGVTEDEWRARVRQVAQRLTPVALTPLELCEIDGFVALVPGRADIASQVADIESACVRELDDLRDPLTPTELDARRAAGLDAHADALLRRWGYPMVLDRFRLHFTLTGRLEAPTCRRIIDVLGPTVSQLNAAEPMVLDRLCVFVEAGPGRPLVRREDLLFAG
jgi:hypothetical protein